MNVILMKPLILILGFSLLTGSEDFVKGVTEFKAGRYEKAWSLLRGAEKAYGDRELPSALLVDLALAASKTQRFDEAEGYAERVAARDGALAYLRDQVVGAARLSSANKAAKEQDPKKLEVALTEVKRAIEAFGSAILARPDAPEARRNLERALVLEKELEKKKKEAEDKKKKEDEKKDKNKKDKDSKDKDSKDKDSKEKDSKEKDPKKQDQKDKNKKDEDKEKDKEKDKKQQDKKKQENKKDPSKSSKSKGSPEKQQPMQLSPEEKKRMEKILEQYQQALLELKKSRAPKHQPGKKDW